MYIWVYTGEVNAKRIRERYLAAVLHQDIAFFDNVGAGEVTTRIETDTSEIYNFSSSVALTHIFPDLVQGGLSEKVPIVASFISAFITGFALAYARSWRLALAMTSIIPCMGLTGGIMNKVMSTYTQSVFAPISFSMKF